jgi:hypothetical protein
VAAKYLHKFVVKFEMALGDESGAQEAVFGENEKASNLVLLSL